MADDKQPQTAAEAKKNKAFFLLRVVRVVNELRVLVSESRLRIFKTYLVIAQVGRRLLGIPLKSQHTESVRTLYIQCKASLKREAFCAA